jgi:phosphoglycolate phosphatase-like HAD superfamily hydrolase
MSMLKTDFNVHYLIFDFDGVIADSLDSVAFALKRGWPPLKFFPTKFIKKVIVKFVDKPVHARNQQLTEKKESKLIKDYQHIAKVLVAQNRTRVFEGLVDELRLLLKSKNCKLAIVSSGSESYINSVMHHVDLPFDYIYGVETSLSKEAKVEKVCRNWNVDTSQCKYFTDSKTDVIELINIIELSQIVGCSWGWQGYKKLKQILPENQILKEFVDIRKVVL